MIIRVHQQNLEKHGVTPGEVEEALADLDGFTEKTRGGALLSVGKTFSGRFLEIAYRRLADDEAFVFHAMPARDHQKKRYKKRLKNS